MKTDCLLKWLMLIRDAISNMQKMRQNKPLVQAAKLFFLME
ncbi:hypothetical protein F542_15040 [Bibersteinia trehalosi USDA-ARS-USMARC-188]|uniref:Uncharacterized protein n=1 Tax=Bibersteinia trehalosi USDA-ARS-USMARC-188 TaxID=1263829 RepID=A0A4V7IAT6_BIBTR|nr:hypothetical protein F542_15040 [Bibersteinia trehalosi USDA-ARS-USMARC-188]